MHEAEKISHRVIVYFKLLLSPGNGATRCKLVFTESINFGGTAKDFVYVIKKITALLVEINEKAGSEDFKLLQNSPFLERTITNASVIIPIAG
jgi:hypothetical protein